LTSKKLNTELVKLFSKGDMAAFDAIYYKYCQKLHAFVMMYLKLEEDAEEIVQEVFVKIWQSRSKVDVNASFESYLFTIAYNTTMSLLRKRMSETKSREYLKSLQQISTSEEIIEDIYVQELNQKVQSIVDQLTPRQKEIYLLSREEGLTHGEIAKKLNISESTVNNHLVTILKYLKEKLGYELTANILYIFLFFS